MDYLRQKGTKSDELLATLFNHALDGIVLIDGAGEIQAINPAACRLFGYAKAELLGRNVSCLMPEPDASQHDGYLRSYHSGGLPGVIGKDREVQGLRKDGRVFPFRLGVSAFEVGGQKFFAGIIHDLSQQKRREEEVQRLNAALEQKVAARTEDLAEVVNRLLATNSQLKNEILERQQIQQELQDKRRELERLLSKERELGEMKSRFVSLASHEFKTPLSTILSSASLLQRYTAAEHQSKREKHIGRIKSAVHHLNGILGDFLSLGQLEEGKVSYRAEPLDLPALMEEVRDAIRVILKPGQRIRIQQPADLPQVETDGNVLKNILYNLLSNASKYSDEGQSIHCHLERDGGQLHISVQDFGLGIPEEDRAWLFQRFFRGRNTDKVKGTGLGLSIVKRYLEILGGSISFESELGEGTTFQLKVPVRWL